MSLAVQTLIILGVSFLYENKNNVPFEERNVAPLSN
jgi:hypothetical protein